LHLPDTSPEPTQTVAYEPVPEGRLASVDANFIDPPANDSAAYEDDFPDGEGRFDDDIERQLARQFSDDYDPADEHGFGARPAGLRGLQWIRKNMTSLRVIVSLQRVGPPEPPEFKPRKVSGN
jgi:hypothetical protein